MTAAVDLAPELERARRAGARQARRPRREVADVLAAAARRWRDDPALRDELPAQAGLHPATLAAALTIAADALDADAMLALVEDELDEIPPARPWLVADVLASNVPALALPAIALACLAGAAVVVKSGRADRVSAPAFRRALESEDPELAASVVTTYWTGGDVAAEDAALRQADRIVASGYDASIAALARRHDARLIGHGERASIAVLGRDAAGPRAAAEIARDVALEQMPWPGPPARCRAFVRSRIALLHGDTERPYMTAGATRPIVGTGTIRQCERPTACPRRCSGAGTWKRWPTRRSNGWPGRLPSGPTASVATSTGSTRAGARPSAASA